MAVVMVAAVGLAAACGVAPSDDGGPSAGGSVMVPATGDRASLGMTTSTPAPPSDGDGASVDPAAGTTDTDTTDTTAAGSDTSGSGTSSSGTSSGDTTAGRSSGGATDTADGAGTAATAGETGTATSTPPTQPNEAAASSSAEVSSSASNTRSGEDARSRVTVTDADRAKAAKIVAGMSTADKAASVLMVTGKEVIGTAALRKQHFGGVILFAPGGAVDGTKSGTPSQVAAVTAGLRKDAAADPSGVPPLIGIDQEYGAVQRLKNGFTTFPSAAELGAIKDTSQAVSLTQRAATAAAQEMLAVGITVDFAPVFGVLPTSGAGSAIGKYGRAYGSDPDRVAKLVAAAVTGYQSGGVIASMKHFPGLARIATDSHVALPSLDVSCDNWNAHEAIPTRAGVRAGALMVMTGHVLMPAVGDKTLPASIAPTVVSRLLRGHGVAGCIGMEFSGVSVTDSMQMDPISKRYNSGQAAVKALQAGEDLVLMPANATGAIEGIVTAVRAGRLAADRLDQAATAVLALRLASAGLQRPPLTVVHSKEHQALADKARAAR